MPPIKEALLFTGTLTLIQLLLPSLYGQQEHFMLLTQDTLVSISEEELCSTLGLNQVYTS